MEKVHENDYIDANGILTCGICGMALESVYLTDDGEVRFPIVHMHDIETEQAEDEIASLRADCFKNYDKYASATFDDCYAEDIEIFKAYVANFDQIKATGKGLLLYGKPGRGKTYAASCILNALIERKVKCKMTSITRLTDEPKLRGIRIDELRKYDLICIDDYGSERASAYGKETGYEVINRLYAMGKPMIVTTNFTTEQLRNPTVEYTKCFDRLKERCNRIEFAGRNIRQEMMGQ